MEKGKKDKEKVVKEDNIWGREKDVTKLRAESSEERRLFRLEELDDYEVENDDPDVRGWGVYDVTERKLGTVDELIVDPQALKARYMIVDFDNLEGVEGNNHRLLIPVGQASLDEKKNRVYLRNIGTKKIKKAPIYTGDPITREYENAIRQNFSDNETYEERPVSDFYDHDDFNEKIFYGNRRTHHSEVENSKFRSKF